MSAKWAGSPGIRGPTESIRMALLTVSLSGVQLVWGVEMAYCAPYLLSLGLTKSLMSLVWNVGPLSGLITQPIVGVLADRSRSRFGRRRPVMVLGSLAVACALLVLGWTKEIVQFFVPNSPAANTLTIILAVLAIYMVDFAVNAVQACTRALIVDTLPIKQQQHGSAWASRMIAVGNIAGYFAGMIDLRSIFGSIFGDTQFKQLVCVSAIMLLFCISITCFAVTEKVLISSPDSNTGVLKMLSLIWKTLRNLPPNIWSICIVLFWAWVGWFPFQVYSTTFVGEVLKRYDTGMQHHLEGSSDVLGDIARVGSMALVLFSCVSLVASVCLPWLIGDPESDEIHKKMPPNGAWGKAVALFEPYKPDLTTTWIWGHISFAALMFLTLFAGTVAFATFLVALSGVAWALMTWAPFSIVGEEINRLSTHPTRRRRHSSLSFPPSRDSEEAVELMASRTSISASVPPFNAEELSQLSGAVSDTNSSDVSGVYLGIMNIFACLPQFVGSFISFIVFSILEPGKSPEFSEDEEVLAPAHGVNAIAVCLGIGGVCTLMAAHYTMRFKNNYK